MKYDCLLLIFVMSLFRWRGRAIKSVCCGAITRKAANSVYYFTLGDLHTAQVHTFFQFKEVKKKKICCGKVEAVPE